ncbi:MAG: hypothetical protein GC134_00610 [Proteobacteria bacterium]|nr:hypothetical protein [Pseudomonadota bacterium]
MKTLLPFLMLPLVAACALVQEDTPQTEAAPPVPLMFQCGQTAVTATVLPYGLLKLAVDGQELELSAVASDGGARYEVEAGGQTVSFFQREATALLSVNGNNYPTCQLAGSQQVVELNSYHAIGQEPGWHLFLDGKTMTFIGGNGTQKLVVEQPPAQMTGDGSTYTAQGMVLTIWHNPCQDTMDEQLYPDTVSVAIDGQTYAGCGGTAVEGKVQ